MMQNFFVSNERVRVCAEWLESRFKYYSQIGFTAIFEYKSRV